MAIDTDIEAGPIVADLRRELALRTAERDEALAQLSATAEVLQVINTSPGDLAPVFDAMLEKATRLCEAPFGLMTTYDGQRFHQAASYNVPAPLAAFYGSDPVQPGPETGLGRIVRGAELVHIMDLADPGEVGAGDPLRQRIVELGGIRSYVVAALRKDGKLLGTIAAYRQEVRPFSEKQIALLENFAAQAVIAMENARLITETREALEQQSATAEVLGVINSSPGDLAPVFDAMLEKALRLCGGDFGYLQTYDGERFLPVAWRGLPPRFAEYMPRMDQPGPSTSYARILAGAPFVHVTDLQEGDAYRTSPLRRALIELGGARTSMLIALRRDDTLLGTLVIYRQEVRPFSDKHIALLQNFAAQAVIAMENARLLGELRSRTRDLQEALEYQTATSDVLQVISRSTFDLQPVLDRLIETATTLCGTERGLIAIRSGDVYRVMSTFGGTPEFDTFLRQLAIVPGRGTVTGRTLLERRVIQVDDLANDPEYSLPQIGSRFSTAHTSLGVPLLREGEPIGVAVLARERIQPFTERQIELVRTFADQAVIAIENARLLDELRQRTDEIAAINRDLEARVAAQVAELERSGKLRRFLAPQLAELIVAQGDESILETHRREIVVVFCDLRGFTAFAERAEPEEVIDLLRAYHGALGPIIARFEGTLDHYSGDGIMVFFNDPMPCPEPANRAVEMAAAMREAAQGLLRSWRRLGHDLGFGVGIAQGYATLGQIGFAERMDYTAIGTVCNLAARLCAEARDGQILVSSRVAAAVENDAALEQVADVSLKGISQPVVVYNVA